MTSTRLPATTAREPIRTTRTSCRPEQPVDAQAAQVGDAGVAFQGAMNVGR